MSPHRITFFMIFEGLWVRGNCFAKRFGCSISNKYTHFFLGMCSTILRLAIEPVTFLWFVRCI